MSISPERLAHAVSVWRANAHMIISLENTEKMLGLILEADDLYRRKTNPEPADTVCADRVSQDEPTLPVWVQYHGPEGCYRRGYKIRVPFLNYDDGAASEGFISPDWVNAGTLRFIANHMEMVEREEQRQRERSAEQPAKVEPALLREAAECIEVLEAGLARYEASHYPLTMPAKLRALAQRTDQTTAKGKL